MFFLFVHFLFCFFSSKNWLKSFLQFLFSLSYIVGSGSKKVQDNFSFRGGVGEAKKSFRFVSFPYHLLLE